MAIRANSTPVSKAAIMKAAWTHYRKNYANRPFYRAGFQWALRHAWWEVKEAARLAAIPAEVKAARVEQINAELAYLPYRSFRYNNASREQELRSELRQLAA